MNTRSQDISDIVTMEGIKKLKKGQILRFDYEGSVNELKITYINKKEGKVLAKETQTYTENEVSVVDKRSARNKK